MVGAARRADPSFRRERAVSPQLNSSREIAAGSSNRPIFYLFEDGDEFVDLGTFEDAFDALVVDVGVGRFVEAGGVHYAVGDEVAHDFI
jgi:hypothetical protein